MVPAQVTPRRRPRGGKRWRRPHRTPRATVTCLPSPRACRQASRAISARRIQPGMPSVRNCARAASSSGRAHAASSGRSAAGVHQRLVVVDDRAEWTGALLVKYGAGFGEPLDRLVVALLQRAEPRQGEPAVHHWKRKSGSITFSRRFRSMTSMWSVRSGARASRPHRRRCACILAHPGARSMAGITVSSRRMARSGLPNRAYARARKLGVARYHRTIPDPGLGPRSLQGRSHLVHRHPPFVLRAEKLFRSNGRPVKQQGQAIGSRASRASSNSPSAVWNQNTPAHGAGVRDLPPRLGFIPMGGKLDRTPVVARPPGPRYCHVSTSLWSAGRKR